MKSGDTFKANFVNVTVGKESEVPMTLYNGSLPSLSMFKYRNQETNNTYYITPEGIKQLDDSEMVDKFQINQDHITREISTTSGLLLNTSNIKFSKHKYVRYGEYYEYADDTSKPRINKIIEYVDDEKKWYTFNYN